MIWFTSDHHFDHTNIIKYCNRPFASMEEMNLVMIERWNEVVGENDTVYYLGDFVFRTERVLPILNTLRGRVIFLEGNHDGWWSKVDVPKIPQLHTLRLPQIKNGEHSQRITMCHYPLRSWDASHYGTWHLYGHHHGTWPSHGLSFDVGVDAHYFYPWSLDEVVEKMKTLTPAVEHSPKGRVKDEPNP